MALDPLATVADLTSRGLTVEPDETAVVGVYLDVASAAVREAAGCPISQTTSTVTLDGEPEQRLRLPGPPVTAVAAVLLDGEAVTDWRLRSSCLWRAGGWAPTREPSEVVVTYTHGLPVVPADIVDLVCRIAAATLVAYRAEDGGTGLAAQDVRAERIGDYSVTYGDSGRITEVELPDYLRNRLRARFGGGAAVVRSR
ncbi:head-tail connector protein [Streptomyces lavendulocolor]